MLLKTILLAALAVHLPRLAISMGAEQQEQLAESLASDLDKAMAAPEAPAPAPEAPAPTPAPTE
jgi:hypothetical protein